MTTTKKFLLIGSLIFGALAIFGYKKVQKLKSIFDKMTMTPNNIYGVDINWQRVAFTMDVNLSNPTNDDFYVTGSVAAELNKINIFYKGKYLANANLNSLNEVSVPAKGEMIIPGIGVEIPVVAILQNSLIFDPTNFSMNDITVSGVVTAFGTEYLIEN